MYQTSIRNKKKHSKFQQNREMDYLIDTNYEEYAYVITMLGNCRVQLVTDAGSKCIGIIRGSLRKFNKRILIEKGDIVVVSKRDFQEAKVDIVHKFNFEQTQMLIKDKKISDYLANLFSNKKNINDEDIKIEPNIDCDVDFGDEYKFNSSDDDKNEEQFNGTIENDDDLYYD